MKKVLFIMCLVVLICVGCGKMEVQETGTESILTQDISEGGNTMDISTTKSIVIKDVIDGIYLEELNIEVPDSLYNEFMSFQKDIIASDDAVETKLWYALEFLDMNNQVVQRWVIDSGDTIISSDGLRYERINKVDEWLSEIEKSCGLSRNLLSREPGQNYLGLFDKVGCINLTEVSVSMIGVLDYDFTEDEIASFKNLIQSSYVDNEKKEAHNIKYVLNMYTEDGSLIYIFHIDEDLNIYTEYGYPVINSDIKEYIIKLIEK